jgi:hypothetical protein
MAAPDDSPPKDISKWLTAPETLTRAEASKGQFAGKVLIDRLKGGVLIAVASKTSQAVGTGPVTLLGKSRAIAVTLWQHRTDDSFWGSGDVHFRVGDPRAISAPNNVWCYDIRFDPDVIAEMFPPPPKTGTKNDALIAKYGYQSIPPPGGAPQEPPPKEQDQKGPPVSQAALEVWFKAYQLAYPASSDDTEGKALESARGCFPGKSVSRDAVRKVRGAQRRGRKPTTAK